MKCVTLFLLYSISDSVSDLSKGLFRLSRKGGGWSFCWGVPVSNKVSEGGMNICKGAERGYPFFTLTKNKTEHGKMPLSCNSPAVLDAPFVPLSFPALKSFRHPGGAHF